MSLDHRELAAQLFNRTWDLMDQEERTPEEIGEMLRSAHASRYHWSMAGGPREACIGEWQISRVYALVGWAEPAAWHGEQSRQWAENHDLGPFLLGYAYEALARAARIRQQLSLATDLLSHARILCASIDNPEDQLLLAADLEGLM